jgi:RHS repeat-associated protein
VELRFTTSSCALLLLVALATHLSAAEAVAQEPQTWRSDDYVSMSTGAAVLEIPIEVPKGTGGFEPKLSLRYSSHGGDGPFGLGWDLRLGEIARTLRFGTPAYNASDQFELDGELLVFNSAENRYHTSTEQFWRIRRVGDAWEVTYTNGNKAWYGRTEASRIRHVPSGAIARWLLSDLDDANGNRISIQYSAKGDPGMLYPDVIAYSYRADNDQPVGGLKYVRFLYESTPRPDVSLSFPGGVKSKLSWRVREIRSSFVAGGEQPFRRLALNYATTGHATQRSRLVGAKLYGSDCPLTANLSTCTGKPLQQFTYADPADVVGANQKQWLAPGIATVFPSETLPFLEAGTGDFDRGKDLGYRFAEVNGDGLIDILRADKKPEGGGPAVQKVFLNTGGTWVESYDWSQRLASLSYSSFTFQGSGGTLNLQPIADQIWFNRKPIWDDGAGVGKGAGTAQVIDLDGDGLADLVVAIEFRSKNRNQAGWNVQTVSTVFRNTGEAMTGWVPAPELAGVPALTLAVGIDAGDPAIPPGVNLQTTQISGRKESDPYFIFPTGAQLVELNGDGRLDVLFAAEPAMAKAFAIKHNVACGSAGPGYSAALLSFMPTLPTGAWLNTSAGWLPHPGFTTPRSALAVASGIPGDTGVRFTDVNRDGLDDLVKAPVDASGIQDVACGWVPITPFQGAAVYLNTGSGWCDESACPEAARYRLPVGVTFARRWDPLYDEHSISSYRAFLIDNQVSFLDLNADGSLDLMRADGTVDSSQGLRAWLHDPGGGSSVWVEDQRFAPHADFAATEVQTDNNPENMQFVFTRGVRFIDMDGDGAIDLLRSAQHLSGGSELRARSRQGFTDVLVEYANGQGGVIGVTYQGADRSSGDERLHFDHLAALAQQDEAASLPHGVPRWVRQPIVKEILRSASDDDPVWTSRYFFVRPRWCRTHRSGLGFRAVDVWEDISMMLSPTNPPQQRLRRTYFEQEHGIAGLPSRQETFHRSKLVFADWDEYLRRSHTFDRVALAGAVTGVRIPRLLSDQEQNHHEDGAGASQSVAYEYHPSYPASFVTTQTIVRPTGTVRITRTPEPANSSTWIRGLVDTETTDLIGASTIPQSIAQYDYDTKGRLHRIDRTIKKREAGAPSEGVATTIFLYDNYGNLILRNDPDGLGESYCYDGSTGTGCPSTTTSSFAVLSGVKDKLGATTALTTDPGTGDLREVVRFNGDRVRIVPDGFGRPTQVFLRPAGAAEFLLESWTTIDGTSGPAGQPSVERLELVGDGTSVRTAAYLDGFGAVERAVRDGDGGWIGQAMRREGEGRLWKETKEVGCPDATCSQLSVDQPGTPQHEYRYDALGRLVEVLQPDGGAVQIGFRREQRSQPSVSPGAGDAFDAVLVRDAEGNLTRRIMDGERAVWIEECHATATLATWLDFFQGKQLHTATCPGLGGAGSPPTTFYTYDGDGVISAIYDQVAVQSGNYTAASRRLKYVYDTLGEVRRIEDPDGGTQTMAYNLLQKTTTWTNPRGETAVYFYDALDRLEEVHPPGYPGSGSPILIDYDPVTRARSAMSHGSAYTLEYDYDSLGRLARKTQNAGGHTMLMDYTYDLLDRPTVLHYPDDTRIRYEYAGALLRKVCEVSSAAGTCSAPVRDYLTHVDYDGAGRVEQLHTPPGVVHHQYNESTDRLERMWLAGTSPPLLDLAYAHDLNGRATSVTDGSGASPSASATYDYDHRGRLTRHDLGGTDKYFKYDTLGNLFGRDLPTPTSPANLGYSAFFPHRLTSVSAGVPSDGTRQHDLAGNVTRRGSQHLAYDWQARLTCVGTSQGVCNTRNFFYDLDGGRLYWTQGTTKVLEFGGWMEFQPDTSTSTTGTTEVRVRALGRTIATKSRSGMQLRTAEAEYLPLLPRPPPWLLWASLAGALSALLELARRRALLVGFVRRPVPASISLLVACSLLLPPASLHAGGGGGGPLVQWVFSDPLGSGVLLTNSNATSVRRRHFEPFGRVVFETSSSGSWPRRQFAGHLDDGIGLYDAAARHYDPDVGQFVQIDPLLPDPYEPADLNPYAYVRNDPLNQTDLTGAFPDGGLTLGAIFVKFVLPAILTAAQGAAIHYAVSPESYHGQPPPAPPPAAGPAARAAIELAQQDRSVATRTGLHSTLTLGALTRPGPDVHQASALNAGRLAVAALGALASRVTRWIIQRRQVAKEAAEQAADRAKREASEQAERAARETAEQAARGAGSLADDAARAGPKIGEMGGPGAGRRFPESVRDAARAESETCVLCGVRTTRQPGPTQSNIDHAIPRSRGGSNTLGNAQNTCRTCNLDKGARTTEEYLELLGR